MTAEVGEMRNCPLCGGSIGNLQSDLHDVYRVSCPVCGKYSVTEEAVEALANLGESDRRVLSGRARENSECHVPGLRIHTKNIDELLADPRVPRWPSDKMDKLIMSVCRRSGAAGSAVDIRPSDDLSTAYAESVEEFNFLVESLRLAGHIQRLNRPGGPYRLTVKGWERVRELERTRPRSDQCFVAMWFDRSVEQAFDEGIRRAIEEAGYKALRVDLKEHNEKICDVIVAEIRRSALLVADCTGHRQGVYFEAGFAMGLGIPCIFTCKEDDIKEAHFDTRQYNHIVWKDPDDLYTKLLRRIMATCPLRR